MPTKLESSAPHIVHPATYAGPLKDWGYQPDLISGSGKSDGVLLHKSPDAMTESGLWQCTASEWPLSIPRDELCHFISGSATYESEDGTRIDVSAGSVVLFRAGWRGTCTVHHAMRNVYMLNNAGDAAPPSRAVVMHGPANHPGPFKNWGLIPTMIEGASHTSGTLLHKGRSGESEAGIWICTPGYWNCHVTRDEFCHFLLGRCTYTHESGEIIEILPDTAAFFPKDWRGTCQIYETIRKVYMIS